MSAAPVALDPAGELAIVGAVLALPGLSPAAAAHWVRLRLRAGALLAPVVTTQEELGRAEGASQRTVTRYHADLAACGLLEVVRRGALVRLTPTASPLGLAVAGVLLGPVRVDVAGPLALAAVRNYVRAARPGLSEVDPLLAAFDAIAAASRPAPAQSPLFAGDPEPGPWTKVASLGHEDTPEMAHPGHADPPADTPLLSDTPGDTPKVASLGPAEPPGDTPLLSEDRGADKSGASRSPDKTVPEDKNGVSRPPDEGDEGPGSATIGVSRPRTPPDRGRDTPLLSEPSRTRSRAGGRAEEVVVDLEQQTTSSAGARAREAGPEPDAEPDAQALARLQARLAATLAECGPLRPLAERVLEVHLGGHRPGRRRAHVRVRLQFAALVRDLAHRQAPSRELWGPVRVPRADVLEDALRRLATRALNEPTAAGRWVVTFVNHHTPAAPNGTPNGSPLDPALADAAADAEAAARRRLDEERERRRRIVRELLAEPARAEQLELAVVRRVAGAAYDAERRCARPAAAGDFDAIARITQARGALVDELAAHLDGATLTPGGLALLAPAPDA